MASAGPMAPAKPSLCRHAAEVKHPSSPQCEAQQPHEPAVSTLPRKQALQPAQVIAIWHPALANATWHLELVPAA